MLTSISNCIKSQLPLCWKEVNKTCVGCCENSKSNISCRCSSRHYMCVDCLGLCLSSMVGSEKTQSLVCGCLSLSDTSKIIELSKIAKMKDEVEKWLKASQERHTINRLAPCRFPECSFNNWLPRELVLNSEWKCKAGHLNRQTTQSELFAINQILDESEFIKNCTHDSLSFPKYRVCPICLKHGQALLCEHAGGCKRFPDYPAQHLYLTNCCHEFCFHCLRSWSECGHYILCTNPGIQRLSIRDSSLEVSYDN